MRSAESRIILLLIVSVCLVVGATLWLSAGQQPITQLLLLRYVGIITGSGLFAGLAGYALNRHWIQQRMELLQHVQQRVLAGDASVAPGFQSTQDKILEPVTSSLRGYVGKLQALVDQLQMQRKDLEIQVRLADTQRRQSEAMIHGISDAVLVSNPFNEIVLANPAAAQLFHFDLTTALRKPIMELIPDPTLAAEICDMRNAHRRSNRRTLEMQLQRDGQMHTYSLTLSCVLDDRGELSGVVTVLHDITREKEVAKMKSDFVSHVSHELRTPLSSIKAYAEMLVDGEAADDKTRVEFYQIIHGEAERLGRLIDNILNISRIEAGVTRITRKAVPLTGILKEALEVAMPSAREKSITLSGQLAPVFFQVEVDRDMIYQAVLNLISNAIKYTPPKGSVTVKTSVNDESHEVTVEVIDNGAGIPPDAMKHLFEKFYRVEQNKGMAKGSGLGLNLTRQIVESIHKGKMHVRSEVGKGSTFGFSLPMVL